MIHDIVKNVNTFYSMISICYNHVKLTIEFNMLHYFEHKKLKFKIQQPSVKLELKISKLKIDSQTYYHTLHFPLSMIQLKA